MEGVKEYNASFGGSIFKVTLQECGYRQGKDLWPFFAVGHNCLYIILVLKCLKISLWS